MKQLMVVFSPRNLADGLRRLKVSIDAAGPNQSFDRVVRLNGRTVSVLGLTASLMLDCEV